MSLIFGFPLAFSGILLCVTLKGNELAHQILVYIHDSRIVIEVATIILCTEDGHQLLLGEELIAILLYLMPAHDQIQFMLAEELLYDLIRENETDAAVIFAPFLRHEVEDKW